MSELRDAPEMIRVFVADNSRIHTRLLAEALKRDAVLHVIPHESDTAGLVTAVTNQNIDVLVISSNLDEQPSHGLKTLRELRAVCPQLRAVLLLDSSKDEVVLDAFRAGARGLFGRNDPVEMLSACVRSVHRGEIWANHHHLNIALSALANSPTVRAVNAEGMNLLSERELEVVRFLAEGLTNREIAERMKLSQHTVKNYLFRVFDKLGVSSRVELLFMTLSHVSESKSELGPLSQRNGEAGYTRHESDLLKKSAEAGLPAAQLALAQLYLNQRNGSQDLVEAYKWYLIATERALQSREFVTRLMTQQQIDQAQQKATAWLASRKRPTSSSNTPNRALKRTASGSEDAFSHQNH